MVVLFKLIMMTLLALCGVMVVSDKSSDITTAVSDVPDVDGEALYTFIEQGQVFTIDVANDEGPLSPDDAVLLSVGNEWLRLVTAGGEWHKFEVGSAPDSFTVKITSTTSDAAIVKAAAQKFIIKVHGKTKTPVTPVTLSRANHATEGALVHEVELDNSDPTTWTSDQQHDYFSRVLQALGFEVRRESVEWLSKWQHFEGTSASWNPLSTTRYIGRGETDFNTASVKSYASMADGVDATVQTLKLSYYTEIRQDLRVGAFNSLGIGHELCKWGTADFAKADYNTTCR